MMNNMIGNNIASIEKMTDIIGKKNSDNVDKMYNGKTFADIYNQKTLRSMQGSHFHLPVYRLAIKDLFDQVHVPVLATTLSERSVDYRGFSSQDFLLVMGNEGQGISSLVEECADHLLHIPMLGQAESLNVAVACGIVLFRLL